MKTFYEQQTNEKKNIWKISFVITHLQMENGINFNLNFLFVIMEKKKKKTEHKLYFAKLVFKERLMYLNKLKFKFSGTNCHFTEANLN